MVRVPRFAVIALAITPLVVGLSGAAAGAQLSVDRGRVAAATPRGVVPFHGRFRVSATWGAATGYSHASPAVDFAMPIGTPVYAAGSGFVDFTSNDPRNCNPLRHMPAGGTVAQGIKWCVDHKLEGTRIRIHHDDGTFTMYVHLSRIRSGISARPKTRVTAGQLIGWSGNSGISSGPHLHFSRINAAGTATIDPGILRACWGAAAHNYGNLKARRGTTMRNDSTAC